jgi:hypothetical protein
MLVALGAAAGASAQFGNSVSTWSHSFGDADYTSATRVVAAHDGTFAVAGEAGLSDALRLMGETGHVLMVRKMDAGGGVRWGHTFAPFGMKANYAAKGLAEDRGGNLIVAGSVEASDDEQAPRDVVLMKVSPAGKQLWARRYGAPGDNDEAEQVLVTPAGDYLVLARSGQSPASTWLFEVGSDGTFKGESRFPGELYGGISPTAGGYLLTGPDLMKVDTAGKTVWHRKLGMGLGAAMAPIDETHLLVTTLKQQGGGYFPGIAMTSLDGKVAWTRIYRFAGMRLAQFTTVVRTPRGFLLGGLEEADLGAPNEGFVMMTDSSGTPVWKRDVAESGRGSMIEDLAATPDHGYLAVGNIDAGVHIMDNGHGLAVGKGLVIKTDDAGNSPGLMPVDPRAVRTG